MEMMTALFSGWCNRGRILVWAGGSIAPDMFGPSRRSSDFLRLIFLGLAIPNFQM